MWISRRDFLGGAATATILGVATPGFAITAAAATSHIQVTIDEIRRLLHKAAGGPVGASSLRKIMKRRANLPLIAQFCAGRSWREMNRDQRQRYVQAFEHYISVTYARRFNDFSGTPEITLGRTVDAGRKGILVESPIAMPDGKRYMLEWLVSDRAGPVAIVDLVIERVSLAATQRDEIGAMLDKRGGDVDALIKALRNTA